MAITYHAGRRIQGLAHTASNLTTSGFAGTWGKDPSNSQFEVSGGKINFLDNTSSTGDRTWLDLESIIGSAVSTTQWVLRFKFNFSTLTSGTYYYEFDAGLSDTTVNNITAQNFIGVRVLPSNFNNLWRPRTCDGSTSPRSGATANITMSFSTGTDYYCEIKRTSSSNWSISLSTTDAYDGDIQDNSYTDAGSSTGLRYFKFGDAVTNSGSGFTMQGVCDVLEFYNDTTTIVVASGDEKPTNVQVGSRFEETDTRKMYHYEVATSDALWGKNSDQVIEDFTTYADTTEGDASWITSSTSQMRVNPTTDVFDFTNSASTQDIIAYYDIGTANISDTAWVCRFKWDFTTYTPSTVAAQVTLFNVGLTSLHEGGWSSSEDYLQIEIISVGSSNEMRLVANNNGTVINNTMDITPSATTYYVELARTSATNFRVKVFSDSSYTTQLGSTSNKTISSAYTGLRYFTVHMKVESTNGNQIGTIDDIEFWNGVTTVPTGNAWKEEGT